MRWQNRNESSNVEDRRGQQRPAMAGLPLRGPMGKPAGERRLARARRPEEYGGRKPVGLNRAAKQPPLPHDVSLAQKFVQIAGTHAVGKRRQSFDAG